MVDFIPNAVMNVYEFLGRREIQSNLHFRGTFWMLHGNQERDVVTWTPVIVAQMVRNSLLGDMFGSGDKRTH